MKAIILAAGRGRRLAEYSNNLPKCMLSFGGKTLLDYQIESVRALGITEIVMVVGFEKEVIIEHTRRYTDIIFTFIENREFDTTNTAFSLWLARHEMNDDFMYMNADVLFPQELTRRLFYAHKENALAVIRKQCGDEEVKVVLDDTKIQRIGKQYDPATTYGEFIGIAKFSATMCESFARALQRVHDEPGGNERYFEAALDYLTEDVQLTAVDITDLPCIEIDFPEDFIDAKNTIARAIDQAEMGHRPRILFYVERNLHVPFLEPVHDYIAQHYDAELAFSSPPYIKAERGQPGVGIAPDEIRRLKHKTTFYPTASDFEADICVVADSTFYEVRHCKKIVTVGHGLISKGFYYTDKPIVRRENHADLICVPGEWHKQELQKNVYTPIAVTGFIKSDVQYRCTKHEIDNFKTKYGVDPEHTIVLFAPTFNEDLSAIPCVKDRIAEITDASTTVLIKLHGMTGDEWVRLYEHCAEANENVVLVDNEDYHHAMVCADVMISDVSSAYVEFMLLDKPVVLFNNPLMKQYIHYDPSDIEHTVRDAAIEVSTVEEMKLAVKLSLLDPEEYSAKRRKYADMLNCAVDGDCAKRAADEIMKLAHSGEQTRLKNVDFSVIIPWDRAPSLVEVEHAVDMITSLNKGVSIEIICIGPRPFDCSGSLQSIADWIDVPSVTSGALNTAFQCSRGSMLVCFKPRIALPDRWLQWMYNYFLFHPDAGAVKALSSREPYRQILDLDESGKIPAGLHGIQEFFNYCLMGNDLASDHISGPCIMISRDIFQKTGLLPENVDVDQAFVQLGQKVVQAGFTMWHALEVFAIEPEDVGIEREPLKPHCEKLHEPVLTENTYPAEKHTEEVPTAMPNTAAALLAEALTYKKEKDFHRAVELLEKAKSLLCTHPVSRITNAPLEQKLFENELQNFIATAKQHKKDAEYHKVIEVLEQAKYMITKEETSMLFENAQGQADPGPSAADLLAEARLMKKEKNFNGAIDLLNQAKRKIA